MGVIVDHEVAPRGERPFGVIWVLDVPWAHPLWSQYLVAICDLTTVLEEKAPMIARPGMTHELQVWALDPDKRVTKWADRPEGCLLTPMNHGYQFKAADDDAALGRIEVLVQMIVDQKLSPDTDFRQMWDQLFSDGVTLRISAFELAGATMQ